MSKKISQSKKKYVAGKQHYKCANRPGSKLDKLVDYVCPLWNKNNSETAGSFDESGYEIDHIEEFSINQNNNDDNLQALCKNCHSIKTKKFMMKKETKKNTKKPSVTQSINFFDANSPDLTIPSTSSNFLFSMFSKEVKPKITTSDERKEYLQKLDLSELRYLCYYFNILAEHNKKGIINSIVKEVDNIEKIESCISVLRILNACNLPQLKLLCNICNLTIEGTKGDLIKKILIPKNNDIASILNNIKHNIDKQYVYICPESHINFSKNKASECNRGIICIGTGITYVNEFYKPL